MEDNNSQQKDNQNDSNTNINYSKGQNSVNNQSSHNCSSLFREKEIISHFNYSKLEEEFAEIKKNFTQVNKII